MGGSLGTAGSSGPDNRPAGQRRWLPSITAGVAVAWEKLRGLWGKPQATPQASLTYELYTQDSVLVKRATCSLSATGEAEWQQLQQGFRAREGGYVQVYLANASATNAWFDDLQAEVFPVLTQQENHYDPFGQNLPEIELTSATDRKEQYTGQEKVDEFGLSLADYNPQYYDFQLGCFQGIDADVASYISQSPYNYCLNNSVGHADPDGKNPRYLV
ncbi:hypothetical protein IC235_11850 [Hymenobacter sp. BT664]|uniref:RHS repeat-associated core domain-containing protein n=1 Tax=Hymenobacter montanus TaxID=2771359 RepID=A0A927GJM9_9BACT|nr:RHS repeat-associated core domain-containing protein [Hymenobacter montanus]MBD2768580.1 hypothetical protein [Hymenobacter montanus]